MIEIFPISLQIITQLTTFKKIDDTTMESCYFY